MRLLVAVALAGLLTSCASMNGDRANGPTQTYATARSPAQFRDCVNERYPGVQIAERGEGGWTFTRGSGGVWHFADVTPSPTGAKVEVFGSRGMRVMMETCV